MFKWIGITRRALRLLYQMCYIILLFDLAMGLFKQPVVELKWILVTCGTLIISYLLREHTSRGVILFLYHLIMLVAVFFLVEPIIIRVFIMITVFAMFLDGFYYIMRGYLLKRMFDVPWGSVVLGIACSGLATYMKNEDLLMIGYIVPIVVIIIFMISLYLEGLEEYIHSSKHVTGAPMKQIVSVNSMMISGIICISFVILFIADLLNLDFVLMKFVQALFFIIKVIIVLIVAIMSFIYAFFGGPGYGVTMSDVRAETEGSSILVAIIQFILILVLLTFITYMLIRFFRWLIRLLMTRFMRGDDLAENLRSESKNVFEKVRLLRGESLKGNSTVIRARRIYKKKVLSYGRIFRPQYMDTTGDIEVAMRYARGLTVNKNDKIQKEDTSSEDEKTHGEKTAQKEDMSRKDKKNHIDETDHRDVTVRKEGLTALYEKVRYGNHIPDHAFLDKMKHSSDT